MRLGVLAAGLCSIVLVTSVYAEVCDPSDPGLLKPELVAQPPSRIRLLTRPGHRQLMFTTTIANLGDGPLIVHGQPQGSGRAIQQELRRADGTSCTLDVGFVPFAAGGAGFQLDDFAEYQLRRDDPFTGPIVARSTKTVSCLLNRLPLRGSLRAAERFDCSNPNGDRGISVGFAHSEDGLAPGQSLDLDTDSENPVPPGNYFLVIVVNPDGVLLEKTDEARATAGVVSIAVSGGLRSPHQPRPRPTLKRRTPPVIPDRASPLPATPTPTVPAVPTPTPARGLHPGRPPISLPPGHEGCGGHHGKICSAGEFCEFLENRCTIARDIGVCTPLGGVCSPETAPVCGCNGVTYPSDCERRRAGVSAAHRGPC